jgi:hypothetical protein
MLLKLWKSEKITLEPCISVYNLWITACLWHISDQSSRFNFIYIYM